MFRLFVSNVYSSVVQPEGCTYGRSNYRDIENTGWPKLEHTSSCLFNYKQRRECSVDISIGKVSQGDKTCIACTKLWLQYEAIVAKNWKTRKFSKADKPAR